MLKNRIKTVIYLFCLPFVFMWGIPGEAWIGDKISATYKSGRQALAWGGEHKELIGIVGNLMQIPSILTVDSENSWANKASLALDAIVLDGKVLTELFQRQEGCLAKSCVYNVPKVFAYLVLARYEHLLLFSEQNKTLGSEELWGGGKSPRAFKISQCFQIGIEIAFRIFAYMDLRNGSMHGGSGNAGALTEAADWVALWRLFERLEFLADKDANLKAQIDADKQKIIHFVSGR